MKIKSLLSVALIFSASAFAAEESAQEKINYDHEVLGGYMSVSTEGATGFTGVNLEYRKHQNDYFGYGAAISYSYNNFINNGYNRDSHLSALDANLIVKFPISKAYIYGKAGLSLTAIKFDISGINRFYRVGRSIEDSDFAPFFGAGVSIPISDRWLIDLSATRKEPSFKFGSLKAKAKLDSVFVQLGYKF